ncbi:MAG: response regulator [Lachnospiraceae bacterium]|nr:response regulator [Lachnospiraceae bacterium]
MIDRIKEFISGNRKNMALICVGIVLDVMGKSITSRFDAPFFLDSAGTILTAMKLGPVAGVITALASTVLTAPKVSSEMLFCIPSAGAAWAAWFFLGKKKEWDSFSTVSTSVLVGLLAAVMFTPFNMIIRGGMTGNLWGDALAEILFEYTSLDLICCLAGELFVHIPDKFITIVVLVAAIGFLKRNGLIEAVGEKQVPADSDGSDDGDDGDAEEKTSGKKALGLLFLTGAVGTALTLSVFSCPQRVYASGDTDFSSDFIDTVYGFEYGLTSAEIKAVTQTGDGYIWAGSYSGLYRFDGTDFVRQELDEMIGNAVYLYTDRRGRLWIGTNDSGAALYDPYTGKVRSFNTETGLCSNYVRGICEDKYGNIYVGTATYICRLNNELLLLDDDQMNSARIVRSGKKRIHVYDHIGEVTGAESLGHMGEGLICGVSQDGLLFVLNGDELVCSRRCDLEDAEYTCVACDGNGTLMAGTNTGACEILSFSGNRLEKKTDINSSEFKKVSAVEYSDVYGGFFLACDNGFGFVKNGADSAENLTVNGFDSSVEDICVDKQGDVWFSSSKQGLLKMAKTPFVNLFKKAGQPESAVNAVFRDENVLYVGTDDCVLKTDAGTGKKLEDERLSLFEGVRVRHIMKDSRGNLWFSTYGPDGLVKMEPSGKTLTFNESTNALGTKFRFAMELNDGRILAASTSGLSFIKGDRVADTIGQEEGLEIPTVLSATEEKDGTLIVGTDGGGLYSIKDGKIAGHWGQEEGLLSQVIMKITPCTGGRVYTTSNGFYYHDGGTGIRKLENFPFRNVYDLYLTEEGQAFVSSSAGIYVVSEKDLLEDREGYSYCLLNRRRGLTSNLTANAWNDVSGDTMYLCCVDGVRMMDLKSYAEFDPHYQIVIKNIKKNDEIIESLSGVYDIPAGNGSLIVSPAILNYTVSDPMVYVELEGVDTEGHLMRQSEMRELYYPYLPFGDYKMKVRVMDDLGLQTQKEAVFLLHKDAKLYEKLYFRIYLGFVIFMMLLFVVWLVTRMENMAVINRQYDQIREAKEEAEHANQAKSLFLAQMSHEIRTPINAVLGMDEMILRESREPDVRGYAADIYTAGQSLLALINDILDSSKIDSGKMEIVPGEYRPSEMIRDLVNMISQRAQAKDLTFEVEADPGLPSVLLGDDVRIKQVVTNLLTNAVKYTVTGNVWLRVSGTREDDTLKLHIEVEDTGKGIKDEDLPKLFVAYQRIEEGRNRRIEGTGLGINITVELLRLMGSRLCVDSIYGRGSKFYFDLDQKIVDASPMGELDRTVRSMEDFALSDDAFVAEDAKILVVDDNSMNRKVFRSLLSIMKPQISEAASGPEAIAQAEREHFDIIFMDHMMPGMDGVTAMKRIKEIESCRDIPIYVLTANAVAGAREEYISMGFDGFLSKPVDAKRLEEVLRSILPPELIRPMTAEEREKIGTGGNRSANPMPSDLPDVEGLDWNYAWLHLPDTDMLRDAAESFYEVIDLQADRLDGMYGALSPKSGSRMDDMRKDTGEGEDDPISAYRIQVHGMKSSAATIGIVPLAGMAKILEFAARDGDIRVIRSMHDIFINEWRSYRDRMKGVFGLGEADVDHSSLEQGDAGVMNVMLDMLTPALEDLDVDTMDELMEKMKGYTFGPEVDELVPKLSAAVRDMDEEMALGIMDEIRALL